MIEFEMTPGVRQFEIGVFNFDLNYKNGEVKLMFLDADFFPYFEHTHKIIPDENGYRKHEIIPDPETATTGLAVFSFIRNEIYVSKFGYPPSYKITLKEQ